LYKTNRINAFISILRTIGVCLILTFGALAFSSDIQEIALIPLENMIGKVNKIAKNPAAVHELDIIEYKGDKKNEMETDKIQNTIVKIG